MVPFLEFLKRMSVSSSAIETVKEAHEIEKALLLISMLVNRNTKQASKLLTDDLTRVLVSRLPASLSLIIEYLLEKLPERFMPMLSIGMPPMVNNSSTVLCIQTKEFNKFTLSKDEFVNVLNKSWEGLASIYYSKASSDEDSLGFVILLKFDKK